MPLAGKTKVLLEIARRGPLRARDLAQARIPRAYLRRLCERGVLEQIDRGLYQLAGAATTESNSLAAVAKRVSRSTVCLLSALQVHGLTTEAPHAVWIMIDRHARAPRLTYPSIEVVRASGRARDHGVERRMIEGVTVRVTSPAKTVADCFRYRRHVGLDVALAALRDFLGRSRRRGTTRKQRAHRGARAHGGDAHAYRIDALVAAARADRVYAILRPYLEALA